MDTRNLLDIGVKLLCDVSSMHNNAFKIKIYNKHNFFLCDVDGEVLKHAYGKQQQQPPPVATFHQLVSEFFGRGAPESKYFYVKKHVKVKYGDNFEAKVMGALKQPDEQVDKLLLDCTYNFQSSMHTFWLLLSEQFSRGPSTEKCMKDIQFLRSMIKCTVGENVDLKKQIKALDKRIEESDTRFRKSQQDHKNDLEQMDTKIIEMRKSHHDLEKKHRYTRKELELAQVDVSILLSSISDLKDKIHFLLQVLEKRKEEAVQPSPPQQQQPPPNNNNNSGPPQHHPPPGRDTPSSPPSSPPPSSPDASDNPTTTSPPSSDPNAEAQAQTQAEAEAEAKAKAKAEEEAKAEAEAEARDMEEALRAKEEAERRAKEEAERKEREDIAAAKEEAEKREREAEEAERRRMEELERKAKEEAARREREEEERKRETERAAERKEESARLEKEKERKKLLEEKLRKQKEIKERREKMRLKMEADKEKRMKVREDRKKKLMEKMRMSRRGMTAVKTDEENKKGGGIGMSTSTKRYVPNRGESKYSRTRKNKLAIIDRKGFICSRKDGKGFANASVNKVVTRGKQEWKLKYVQKDLSVDIQAFIGIYTPTKVKFENAPTEHIGHEKLERSYGLNLNSGKVVHLGKYGDVSLKAQVKNGSVIKMTLDLTKGSLSFSIDDTDCGVLLEGLKGPFSPAVSLGAHGEEIHLVNE